MGYCKFAGNVKKRRMEKGFAGTVRGAGDEIQPPDIVHATVYSVVTEHDALIKIRNAGRVII